MPHATVFSTADAVEEAFYDAMQRADVETMMALWADDEDVMCIHPSSGRLMGLAAIRQAWGAIFRNGGVAVRRFDVRAHTGAMLAVHNLVEQVIVEGPTGSQLVECVATNVYVKQPDGWRIVIHHSANCSGETPQSLAGGMLH